MTNLPSTAKTFHTQESFVYKHKIVFNDPNGNIGLKAVDGTKIGDKIMFVHGDDFHYPRESIKHF